MAGEAQLEGEKDRNQPLPDQRGSIFDAEILLARAPNRPRRRGRRRRKALSAKIGTKLSRPKKNPPSKPKQKPTPQPAHRRKPAPRPAPQPPPASAPEVPIDKDKFTKIPHLKERLPKARAAIQSALKYISGNKALMKRLEGKEMELKNADSYLAIAVKESALDEKAISKSNARGYFQVKRIALDEVKRIFPEITFSMKDLYDPQKSSVAGILYWHICRDIYLPKMGLTEEEKDKFACLAYMIGQKKVNSLIAALNPASFKEFAVKIAEEIKKTFPLQVTLPSENGNIKWPFETFDGFSVEIDPTYRIPYRRHLTEGKASFSNVEIGGEKYSAYSLICGLRYTELISTMMHGEPDLPPDSLDAFDYIKEDHRIWSIADACNFKCQTEYKIPYFTDTTRRVSEKIRFLITVICEYNKEVLENPAFEEIDSEDQDPDLQMGALIYLPPKQYIVKKLEESGKENSEAPEETLETVPSEIPMYTGQNAEALKKEGEEKLTYSGPSPKITIPKYKGKELDINLPSRFGKMGKGNLKYIILHSTEGEGPQGKLYHMQDIHYLVKRDGTIEQIRAEHLATNHAGRWANKHFYKKNKGKTKMKGTGTMALWDGDKDVSLHSIGIEIETEKMGELNDAQYSAVKQLVAWIGSRHGIKKGNVLSHSMIGVGDMLEYMRRDTPQIKRFTRGRKQDPRNLDWNRLGLPDNYRRVDPDVAEGRVYHQMDRILEERAGKHEKDKGWYGTNSGMTTGLDAARRIYEAKQKK